MKEAISKLIASFAEGYRERNIEEIDRFIELFSDQGDSQLIGIGATEPGAYEWFTGKGEIKEIILSDWNYWGKVYFDFDKLRISTKGEVGWFSICAALEQVEMKEETWEFFASQMMDLLKEGQEKAADRIFEAAHYGIRRVRERNLGVGYPFKMVITGVVVLEEGKWKFHTLHWAMPVE